MRRSLPPSSILCVALLGGCPAPAPDPPESLAPPAPWPGQDLRPSLDHPFFDAHPGLRDLSLYAFGVQGPIEDRPDAGHRGAFAIGNGLAFAELGLTDPLNTLHGLIGPVYERESSFFGDVGATLEVDGVPAPFQREQIARVRGAGVVVTRADAGEYTLHTVDFAPKLAGRAPHDQPAAFVRILLASRADTAVGAPDVTVRITPNRAPTLFGDRLAEHLVADERYLGYLPWGATLEPGDAPGFPLGPLAPGAAAVATLVLATAEDLPAIEEIAASLVGNDPGDWLDQTLDDWAAWSATGVRVQTSDPRVGDLFDGQRVGIRVQTTASGGVAPMSEYTQVWLRDTEGPVRFLLRAGLPDDARAAFDYMHLCATVEGDYSNSCASRLRPEDAGPEPDWLALSPFGDRQRAEGPSHIPLMARALIDWTGDGALLAERWDWLRRGLLGQTVEEGGRQPFSGDETYRPAMSATVGLPLTFPYEERAWSALSSLLLASAGEWMAEAGAAAGLPGVEELAALGALGRQALNETFLDPVQGITPYVLREDDERAPAAFEDVSLQALWTGAFTPDDPVALSLLAGIDARAGRGDGVFQSPLHPDFFGAFDLPIYEGIATGMVAGFALHTLTSLGHDDAGGAFDALHSFADPAGQYSEDVIYDDRSALQPIYDRTGFLGDYAARHRPWEGAINTEAMLSHLVGPMVEPGRPGWTLRPHLPHTERSLTVTGLLTADGAGSLELTREPGLLRATVRSSAASSFPVRLALPIPEAWPGATASDGTLTARPAGERAWSFPEVELGPGEVWVAEVRMGD